MSEGEIGVTVSTANPFDEKSNSYYNELSNDSNYFDSNVNYDYQYSSNSYTYENSSNNDLVQINTSTQESNSSPKKKHGFKHKAKKMFSKSLQFANDKIGKPIIHLSQKINSNVTSFLHL